jgi:hypothetical protein
MMNEQTKQTLLTAIRQCVVEHYAKNETPLLLSTLGQQLRKEGSWPKDSSINLRTLIDSDPASGLHIVRNPSSSARIAVTDDIHKASVEQIIISPQPIHRAGLGNLPRSLLLAFCAKDAPGETLYVQKIKPHLLQTQPPGPAEKDHFWEISPKFRLDDCEFTSIAKLAPDVRNALQTTVRSWIEEQGLSEAMFSSKQNSWDKSSALARLVGAQPEHLRRLLVIPADIALLLSKHE